MMTKLYYTVILAKPETEKEKILVVRCFKFFSFKILLVVDLCLFNGE